MIDYSYQLSHQLNLVLNQHQIDSVWLLVDPLLRPFDDLQAELEEYFLEAKKIPLAILHDEIAQADCPFFIQFNVNDQKANHCLRLVLQEAIEELNSGLLVTGSGRRFCMLIATNQPATLAKQWARYSIQNREMRQIWLRLHDPAVFWQLWKILDKEQHSQLIEPSEHIWLLDPRANLVHYQSTVNSPIDNNHLLRMTESQWLKIDQIQQVNLVLQQLGDVVPRKNESHLYNIKHQLTQALDMAVSLTFMDVEDQRLFMQHAIKYGGLFYQQQDIFTRLKNKQPDDYYQVIIADLLNDDNELIVLPMIHIKKADE